ncbi:MAG: glycosyltransferase, partial [Rubrivivax sp.]|nr:glycosyltransferase [Rubrivivax sp.]
WNEWAEGSVMEPDVHFGYEILEATRRAKRTANFDPRGTYWHKGQPQFPEDRLAYRERIVLVGHDAFFAGAQTNLLNMARCLKRQLDIDVTIMLIEGGDLLADYERVAPTYLIGRAEGWQEALKTELRKITDLGARKAICNTVVTGDVAAVLKGEGFKVLGLVHELPALIESYDLSGRCWTVADKVDHIVCASRVVADEFCNRYWPEAGKIVIASQGIAFNRYHDEREAVRAEIRKELKLPAHAAIVLGCGHGDTRKGIDLFVQLMAEVTRACEPGTVAFVWVGTLDWQLDPYIHADAARMGLSSVFRVTGRTTDPGRYFMASDLFALTSREDPFPSVVMEAFDARLPVLAFNGAGGYVDIVNDESGALIPYLDVPAMAQAALGYLREPERRNAVGLDNHLRCRERFGYEPYMRKLLALLGDVPGQQVMAGLLKRQPWFSNAPRPTISAIVP